MSGSHAAASEAVFYLAAKQGIFRGSIDTDAGTLGTLTLAGAADHPTFLALSPNRKFLYAGFSHSVAALAVQPDGSLKKLNVQDSGGADACHIATDGSGRFVFAASYGDGRLACFSTKSDGSLDKRISLTQFTGSGPDRGRQEKSHAHSVYADAANKFVYSCDLGSDSVWIFKFDASLGTLTPNHPPSGKVPPGSGPRHLAFHPNGRFVYVLSEMSGTVTVFSRDPGTGALAALETIPTSFHPAPSQDASSAEIVCHPSGRWLYASNRGENTIAVFALAADGKAALIQCAPSVAQTVRSFAIDPDGRWLLAAGQADNRLVAFKIDPATGHLTATDQIAQADAPQCVLFAPGN